MKTKEMKSLKQNLIYSLAKYENKVEEERIRYESNKNVSIQCIPHSRNNYVQVNFIPMTFSRKSEVDGILNAKDLMQISNASMRL